MEREPDEAFARLRYDPQRRVRFLGSLVAAVKGGRTIEIETPYVSVEEFPRELRLLVDPSSVTTATGVGASLSWIAGRLFARGLAFSRVAGGAALLGVSTITLVVGAVLRIYAFRVRNPNEPGRGLRLVGVPRRPTR